MKKQINKIEKYEDRLVKKSIKKIMKLEYFWRNLFMLIFSTTIVTVAQCLTHRMLIIAISCCNAQNFKIENEPCVHCKYWL